MIAAKSLELDAMLAFHEGDVWGGIPSITIVPAPVNPLTRVIMTFVTDLNAKREVDRLDSEDGTTIINNAGTWNFRVPAQRMDKLKAGNYNYGITLIDDDGVNQHYIEGVIPVLPSLRKK